MKIKAPPDLILIVLALIAATAVKSKTYNDNLFMSGCLQNNCVLYFGYTSALIEITTMKNFYTRPFYI